MATDKVAYWLDIANYDLDTAEALYNSGRWLYVAFMCHQVIEKTLKARYPEDKDALSRTLTPQACRQIINERKQLQQWIEGHLPETRPSNSSADTSES
jgi:HEPN domain-containing protein